MHFEKSNNDVIQQQLDKMNSNKEFMATAEERHERAKSRVRGYFPHLFQSSNRELLEAALCLESAYPDDNFGSAEIGKLDIIYFMSQALILLKAFSRCNCIHCQRGVKTTSNNMKKLMALYHSLPHESEGKY